MSGHKQRTWPNRAVSMLHAINSAETHQILINATPVTGVLDSSTVRVE